MSKFTKDNIPQIAVTYSADKREAFLSGANFAFSVVADEETAILAGMAAAGEQKNAEFRARILKQVEKFDAALELEKKRAEFAKNNIIEAEIFAAGTWSRMTFGVADLDEIIRAFDMLREHYKVPLKFGHNDKQPITDGQPAIGWVTRVWRDGSRLMGRFENVPDVVKAAIEQKLYRHVSIELEMDVKDFKNRKFKYVLSAVALLGADRPAVSTLAELGTYVDGGGTVFTASRREAFSAISGTFKQSLEENDMTPEEVQAAITKAMQPLNAKIDDLSKENDTLKTANAKFKASADEGEKAILGEKIKAHRTVLVAKFEAAVKAKQITPAQREMGLKFMHIDKDETVLSVSSESVDDYIKVNGGKARMSDERGKQGGTDDRVDDAGAEIVRLAEVERAKYPKLSFADCRNMVLRANPDLAKDWMGEVVE